MKEIYTKPESVVEEFQTVSSFITTSTGSDPTTTNPIEDMGDLE